MLVAELRIVNIWVNTALKYGWVIRRFRRSSISSRSHMHICSRFRIGDRSNFVGRFTSECGYMAKIEDQVVP